MRTKGRMEIIMFKNKNIICHNCGELLVCIGNETAGHNITAICRCGELLRLENTINDNNGEGYTALKEDENLFCPVCNRRLLYVNKNNVISLAFRIKCKCKHIYDKYSDKTSTRRNLGKFAILEKED